MNHQFFMIKMLVGLAVFRLKVLWQIHCIRGDVYSQCIDVIYIKWFHKLGWITLKSFVSTEPWRVDHPYNQKTKHRGTGSGACFFLLWKGSPQSLVADDTDIFYTLISVLGVSSVSLPQKTMKQMSVSLSGCLIHPHSPQEMRWNCNQMPRNRNLPWSGNVCVFSEHALFQLNSGYCIICVP